MSIKLIQITVSGKVQGVYYRASALAEAQKLGLKGFVKNEPDGSVYAEVEGEEPQLQAFIQWCRKGPPGANVTNVSNKEAPLKKFIDFVIMR